MAYLEQHNRAHTIQSERQMTSFSKRIDVSGRQHAGRTELGTCHVAGLAVEAPERGEAQLSAGYWGRYHRIMHMSRTNRCALEVK